MAKHNNFGGFGGGNVQQLMRQAQKMQEQLQQAQDQLDAAEYELPHALEKKAPIGSKLVFGKWLDPDGNAFWSMDMVYQTPDQLRSLSLLDLKNPPAVFHISLNGMEQNPDGLYAEDALLEHFDLAIGAYDQLIEDYSDSETEVPVLSESSAAG